MANIIRKPSYQLERDPFRLMRRMFDWTPFRENAWPTWQEGLSELGDFAPDFEVKENKDSFLVKGDVPGISEKDLNVSIAGNVLTIAGHRQEEKRDEGDKYYTYERSYGSFTRSFVLPDGADSEHVHTELKDGVLTIALPKKAEVKSRKIEVKRAPKAG